MGFIITIINTLVKGLSDFGIMLLSLLPTSPLRFEGEILDSNIMGYINYFAPVGTCIKIGGSWLTCIALWYIVSIGLRWVKAIE